MRRVSRVNRRKARSGKYAHYVDVIPPAEGLPDSVEVEIIQFLERCAGGFDLYGEIATGDAVIRYCFRALNGCRGISRPVRTSGRKGRRQKGDLNFPDHTTKESAGRTGLDLTSATRSPLPMLVRASLSARTSSDNSTTACRNVMFSVSRNERRLIG